MGHVDLTRRRWFSFRLSSLFVFVTVAAILLAWVAHELRESRYEGQIAKQLAAQGVQITLRGRFDPKDSDVEPTGWRWAMSALCGQRIHEAHSFYWESEVPLLVGLKHVDYLDLDDCPFHDLSPLAELTSLTALELD